MSVADRASVAGRICVNDRPPLKSVATAETQLRRGRCFHTTRVQVHRFTGSGGLFSALPIECAERTCAVLFDPVGADALDLVSRYHFRTIMNCLLNLARALCRGRSAI